MKKANTNEKEKPSGKVLATRILAIILAVLMVVGIAYYTIYMVVDSIKDKTTQTTEDQNKNNSSNSDNHDHGADALRNRIRHVPFFADRFDVGLACAVCAGCKNDGREPGVIRRQQDEPLADHTRSADDTDSEFFHDESSNLQTRRKVPVACHFRM